MTRTARNSRRLRYDSGVNAANPILRWLAAACMASALPAAAAVSCEQLGQLALSTEQMRDQGVSLEQISRDLDALAARGQLSAADAAAVQKAVRDAFLRTRSPNETVLECRERTAR